MYCGRSCENDAAKNRAITGGCPGRCRTFHLNVRISMTTPHTDEEQPTPRSLVGSRCARTMDDRKKTCASCTMLGITPLCDQAT